MDLPERSCRGSMQASLDRLLVTVRVRLLQPGGDDAVEELRHGRPLGTRRLFQRGLQLRTDAPAIHFGFAHVLHCSASRCRRQADLRKKHRPDGRWNPEHRYGRSPLPVPHGAPAPGLPLEHAPGDASPAMVGSCRRFKSSTRTRPPIVALAPPGAGPTSIGPFAPGSRTQEDARRPTRGRVRSAASIRPKSVLRRGRPRSRGAEIRSTTGPPCDALGFRRPALL